MVPNNKNYKVWTDTGWSNFQGIREITNSKTMTIRTLNYDLECTAQHRLFLHDSNEIFAMDLNLGDKILTKSGSEEIISISYGNETTVYDLVEVENNKRYYTNDILSHNCEFVGYDNTLIDSVVMQQLLGSDPVSIDEFDVRWYDKLEPNKTYLIGYDPSSGIDRDSAAIQIISVPDMVQIAEWCSAKISMPDQVKIFKHMINKVYYSLKSNDNQMGEPEVYWSFEQNGGWGETVLNLMREMDEETFLGYGIKEKNKTRLGLYTTGNNKLTACMKLKQLLERRKLKIHSRAFLSQLKNFVTHGGSFAAKQGQHDDLIMSMVICVRILERIKDWDDSYGLALETTNEKESTKPPMPMIFG